MSNAEFQALWQTVWEYAFGKGGAFTLTNDITEPDATFSYIYEFGFTFLPSKCIP